MRDGEKCAACSFYRPPTRDYDHLPRYTPGDMDRSSVLERISFPIESAICSLDRERGFRMKDAEAIEITELLLDLYAFGDSKESAGERIGRLGCQGVIALVAQELRGVDRAEVAKVIGAVRFVARRRNIGGRHHLNLLHEIVGSFVKRGVGLRILDGKEIAVGRIDIE